MCAAPQYDLHLFPAKLSKSSQSNEEVNVIPNPIPVIMVPYFSKSLFPSNMLIAVDLSRPGMNANDGGDLKVGP
jgi:hypothetical protein